MNKLFKRILIGLSAIIGVFVVLIVVYIIVMKVEASKMTLIETGQVIENIYAVKDDYVNMFFIKNGDIKIKGILTPGHTPGSMCWIINDKYLFIGDAMSIKSGKAELFNSIFNMDDDLQARSLKKLAKLKGIKYVFSDHYGYTNDFESAFAKWK